jgi:2,3-bisphosphoglycerate-dependent phosphoglycerate mutase
MHHDRRYATLGPQQVPDSESMRDTADRLLPLWRDTIAPGIASGKRTLIVTHGTTLRALAALIGGLSEPEAAQAEVPNAVPLVYELDAGLHPGRMYYSG